MFYAAHPDATKSGPSRFPLSEPASGRRSKVLSPRPKILIADGDPLVREQIRDMISPLDPEFSEATTGDELNDALRVSQPSLVVASSQLKGQSGLQVLAAVRARGNPVPFIVVTSCQTALLRVFVSDMEGTVLSSRVVDRKNLVALAETLVRYSEPLNWRPGGV